MAVLLSVACGGNGAGGLIMADSAHGREITLAVNDARLANP